MNRLTLTISLFFLCSLSFGQTINEQTAATVAENYFRSLSQNVNRTVAISKIEAKKDASNEVIYYAVSFENGGFVLVSAEGKTNPIIGYSTKSKFKSDLDNFNTFMSAYENKIADVRAGKIDADGEAQKQWTNMEAGLFQKIPTGPGKILTTSLWNQNKYYNAYCPDDADAPYGYDNKTPNGCVAVAMSQIIYYHRYPRTGYGTSSYSSDYGRLSADYGNTVYDYESMSDEAIDYSDAIARLIYHAGISVQMDYAPAGSGTQSSYVVSALRGRFLYATNLNQYSRSGYNDTEWFAMIKQNIDSALPVYYSGCDGSSEVHGCHAWVCSGYDTDNNLYFNWGWGGQNNGFFSLSDMDDYILSNAIIKDIKPRNDTSNFFTGTDTLTATYGSFNDGSGRINYRNNTNCSWLISPQNGNNVNSISLRIAYLELADQNDSVFIYQGNSSQGTLLYTITSNLILSDSTLPTINGSEVFVVFKTDAAGTADGFTMTYTSTRSSSGFCSTALTPTKLTTDNGTITNNSGTNNYDMSTICNFSIAPASSASTNKIGIIFRKFDLAQGDIIEVMKQGTAAGGTMVYANVGQYRFSLDNMPTLDSVYVVDSKTAYVRFISDNNIVSNGFEMDWLSDVGIKENTADISGLMIYPNPASSQLFLNLETTAQNIDLSLVDILGRTVYNETVATDGKLYHSINVDGLAKGIYMLKITTTTGVVTKKVTVK